MARPAPKYRPDAINLVQAANAASADKVSEPQTLPSSAKAGVGNQIAIVQRRTRQERTSMTVLLHGPFGISIRKCGRARRIKSNGIACARSQQACLLTKADLVFPGCPTLPRWPKNRAVGFRLILPI